MAKRKYPRKPGRKKHVYRGISFASKSEVVFAKWMDRNGIPWMYESEKFPYVLPTRRYTPDFKIARQDGSYFFVEYKGWLKPEDRSKIKAFIKQHPGIDFRMVFANSKNKLYSGSETTYGMWCDKLGIQYADKTMPEEWMMEVECGKE